MSVTWQCDKSQLDVQFAEDVDKLLSESPYNWYVTSGYRDRWEQLHLYRLYLAKKGGKAAPPGKSAHEFRLAVDVVLDGSDKPGLQMLWDTTSAGWLWLAWAVRKHPRLHSGMWFADWPHIERVNWKQHISVSEPA